MSERLLDVPAEIRVQDVRIHINENAEALAEYAIDTVFWLAVIGIIASAARRTATTIIGRRIARDDF